jgi:hypothetical protein
MGSSAYNRSMAGKPVASSSYARVVRRLHILMLALCAIASLALFVVDSMAYKFTVAFLLFAYAAFLIRNSHIAALLFRVTATAGNRPPRKRTTTTPRSASGALLQHQQSRRRGRVGVQGRRAAGTARAGRCRWAASTARCCATTASPPSAACPPATSTTATSPPPDARASRAATTCSN